jgi:hypothetical protein
MEAVQKYRLKQTMLDGKTLVPVMITVEVNFRESVQPKKMP